MIKKCIHKVEIGEFCKLCFLSNSLVMNLPRISLHFSGKSAPEVFVGRNGYPNVNFGAFVSAGDDNVLNFSTASEWSKSNLSIENVLRIRSKLIYGKSYANVRKINPNLSAVQELSLSSRPVLSDVFLKRRPSFNLRLDGFFRPLMNAAQISRFRVSENVSVKKPVDDAVNDRDAKSEDIVWETYSRGISEEKISGIFSLGLIGRLEKRRLVPTRWSITAVDDIISKKIREDLAKRASVEEFMVFSGNFLGNRIIVLLCPGDYFFEAFEAWVFDDGIKIFNDYEGFYGRKNYAKNVTGGYYAMRLAVLERLFSLKKKASIFAYREISKDYYAPLGVGVVREAARRAMKSKPEKFSLIEDAKDFLKRNSNLKFKRIIEKSYFFKNYK